MEWIGGTDEAKKLIAELQKDGSLLNFYSKEVLEMPKIQDIFGDISIEDLEKEHGGKFLNHLLVGCFHRTNLNCLVNEFNPCKEYYDYFYSNHYHDTRPCFAIINLMQESICLMSIGYRKGNYFENYYNVSMKNLKKVEEKFIEYDYLDIVGKLRESLETIANIMNKRCYSEDEVTDEDREEYQFQEEYLQRFFPNFELTWIEECLKSD
jgi:hypothetical protein